MKMLVIILGILVALIGICNSFPPMDLYVSILGGVIVGAGMNIKD